MSWFTAGVRSTRRALGSPIYNISAEEEQRKRKKKVKRAFDASNNVEFESGANGQSSAERAMLERSLALLEQTGRHREIQTQAMDAAEAPQDRANLAAGRAITDIESSLAARPRPAGFSGIMEEMKLRAGARARAASQAWTAEQKKALERRVAMAGFGTQRLALAQGQGEVGVDFGGKSRQASLEASAIRSAGASNAAGAVVGALGTWGINKYVAAKTPTPVVGASSGP